MRAVFYDTWAFAALANAADPGHPAAAEADAAIEAGALVAVTSDYVLDETLTLLHVRAGPRVALTVLEHLEDQVAGEALMLVEVTASRRQAAIALFRRLAPDTPRLSFTDCTSMAIMRELAIEVAFTVDAHFRGAGTPIRPLMETANGGLRWRLPS